MFKSSSDLSSWQQLPMGTVASFLDPSLSFASVIFQSLWFLLNSPESSQFLLKPHYLCSALIVNALLQCCSGVSNLLYIWIFGFCHNCCNLHVEVVTLCVVEWRTLYFTETLFPSQVVSNKGLILHSSICSIISMIYHHNLMTFKGISSPGLSYNLQINTLLWCFKHAFNSY